MSIVYELILSPFIILSVFFCSILKETKKRAVHSIFVHIIHLLYAVIISVIFGAFLSIYFIIGLVVFAHVSSVMFFPIMICVILFLFLYLCAMIVLNKNEELNMPEEFINTSVVLISYFKSKHLLKTIGFLGLFSLLQTLLLTVITFCLNVPLEYFPIVLGSLGAISLVVSFLLYYKKSANSSILNTTRRFSLSLLFCLSMSIFTIYRIFLLIKNGWSEESTITIISFVFTIISALKWIPDTWRSLYTQFCTSNAETIQIMWNGLEENYSFHTLLTRINMVKKTMVGNVRQTKKLWHEGQKLAIIKALIFAILSIAITITLLLNQFYIEHTLNKLCSWIWQIGISISGNEKTASIMFFDLILLGWLIWTVAEFIGKKTTLSKNQKITLISRIISIIFLLIPSVCVTLNIQMNMPLIYLMFILMIFVSVLSVFLKKSKMSKW